MHVHINDPIAHRTFVLDDNNEIVDSVVEVDSDAGWVEQYYFAADNNTFPPPTRRIFGKFRVVVVDEYIDNIMLP